ncbi:ABC-2 transporter permease [Propionicimonas sp.]|uniref:ABC-2 transporter permease n=1 Tax=Propionicimonas sp. TaxID=1955623 RepID=UPI0018569D47|nr:ABC-2 transporter permease [Propionicimonas sp.]MBU3976420.1 ABC-2 transporter permease [Actinomycetota bacterium]MBA3021988.1 ABC-2 transporter permease [Propionicimonas sp.]MBU3987577.1 ABC-2 transporter permease [Actinomycetota bacterium]MBU4006478.1 ABC-2 transporter permease [Actinomycetota bacterium]MBU4065083.1 ABC-2 transporter permease [Actinomycetota bacterium]
MTNAIVFARLELAAFRVNAWPMILMSALVAMMTWVSSRQEPIGLAAVLPLLPVFFVTYPFLTDERGHHDLLYATLPIRRQTVVLGRHLFFLAIQLASGVLALALLAATAAATGRPLEPRLATLATMASLTAGSVLLAIQLPLLFWLGFAKSRWIALLPMLVFLTPVALMQLPGGRVRFDTFDPTALPPSLLLAAGGVLLSVSVVAWVISALVSVRVYAGRRF